MKRVLERERFDLLHIHEPMTPAIGTAALSFARVPLVATFHASGKLAWMKLATPVMGFLAERLDHRIAVSPDAVTTVSRYLPGDYEVIPNGVAIPEHADPGSRENRVVFVGRHEPRKGLPVLLRAWPEIRRQTGARLRVVGADPLQVRLLLTRFRISDDGIDALGFVSVQGRTDELLRAKVFVAPSVGGESFGMVLTEAFACATPVVASDIPGYRDVMTPETGVLVPPDDPRALSQAIASLLADEPRRLELGAGARRRARAYSWDDIGRRLLEIYELVAGAPTTLAAAG
jgi:phosphatidylinositol alpha-mannosyltransferase